MTIPKDPLTGAVVYDSDDFLVVAYGNDPGDAFEVVDKQANITVYLHGTIGALMQLQCQAWKLSVPTQDEVEATLAGWIMLNAQPLRFH